MLKKMLTACLAVLIFMSFSPFTLAHEYNDVPQDSPYYYPVHYLRRNDVFKNTPYFYPDVLINKAEFIKYLVILNSPDFRPSGTVSLPFEDTRDNAWYASYFKEAIKLGILDQRNQKAEPDKKLTLIDALTLLFHSQSIPIPKVYKGYIPYTDVERNKQAAPLIMRALSLDIIYPMRSDYVGIYQRITRAQAARMIYKMDLVTLGTPTSNGLPQTSSNSPEVDKMAAVWGLIETTYLERKALNREQLLNSVLRHMVEQLGDPYSIYMNTEENRNFLDALDGEIEGIGAVVGYNEENEISIISPLKGSPAARAGLKPKDVIIAVDDQEITGMSIEEAVLLIKGPRGTTVKLKIRRVNSYQTFIIERELIDIPSLEYELIHGGDIMHIMVSQFNYGTGGEFKMAVSELQSDPRIKGLILDLRGNPGGLLDESLQVLGSFVQAQKELVTINYADYTQTLLSRGKAELNGFPVVVLIDTGSASASEIVAGTLQDYGLAIVVGETSFGKGTVQEVNYFVDNSSLKLTVAKWLTPNRQDIQGDGIDPEIKVKDDPNTEKDESLERGIQELLRLMK